MVNPFNEQRPLAQVLILALIYCAVKFTADHVGTTMAILVAATAALLLPASVAVLGLESNVLKAANPVAWIRIVIGLGRAYALVLAVILGYALLIAFLRRWELWLAVQIAIVMFCILSVFSALAGALYDRRHELGLETWASPERTQELQDARDQRQSEHVITAAYGQMRAGSHIQSWQSLQDWLTGRGHTPDDYRWLCTRVEAWSDPRYITRLTQEYVERLIILKRNGEALDLVTQRLKVEPTFRPKSAATTLQIARIAAAGGAPRVARSLLTDFSTRFAGDPAVRAAGEFAQRLGP
jgi:hypothetical protein